MEQLLAQAEQSRQSDSDIEAELAALGETVGPDDLEQAVEDAREETYRERARDGRVKILDTNLGVFGTPHTDEQAV